MSDNSSFSFVVFTASDMFSVRASIVSLLDEFPQATITVVQHAPKKTFRQLANSQKRNIERHGWRWIPYQLGEILRMVERSTFRQSRNENYTTGVQYAKTTLLQNPRVVWRIVRSIHSPESLDLIKSVKPDLGIALAAPILKRSVFGIPRCGTINLHKGQVPNYKGMPPAFWELKAGETHIGCTVHFVSEKLDAGDVILDQMEAVPPFATVRGMQLILDQIGVQIMTVAARQVLSSSAKPRKQTTLGRTNSRPPLAVERALNHLLLIRTGRRFDMKSRMKSLYFLLYGSCFAPLRDLIFKRERNERVTVLLYHRVNDELRDGVTNGIEQFERHMAILAKKANVVRLCDLLQPNRIKIWHKKPTVIITFDDGYEDNFKVARPILERFGLHATFFVSTGLMGSDRTFDHDQTKLGYGPPNMSWDQIRELKKRGFDIGSHTVNHSRISELSPAELSFELRDSKSKLETELGSPAILFAYPFGGVRDSNAVANKAVFEAGYSLCCSAYGGRNTGLDLKNIKRSTVNFAHDDAAFWAIVQGFSKIRAAHEKAVYEA
jgi:peptidoglycan/xylan/chitin deacetylase (PgdA/CDA1 family)/methionyl-tRNA formyltransferase